MNAFITGVLPAFCLLVPLALGFIELLRGEPRPLGPRRNWGVMLYGASALVLGLFPVLSGGLAGLEGLEWQWAPTLGFEFAWRLTPPWAGVLALSALAWHAALRDATREAGAASCLAQFGLGACVASADVLSTLLGVFLIGIAGVLWALASKPLGRRSSARVAQRFGVELAICLAAGLTLCMSVGLSTHLATHELWSFSWSGLGDYVFPSAAQEQNLFLLVILLAPLVGLFPFGGGLLAVGGSVRRPEALHWLAIGPVAAAAIWQSATRVLAPRLAAELAAPIILSIIVSAVLRVLIARGRSSRAAALAPQRGSDADQRGVFATVPLLLVGSLVCTGTPWGSYAVWLAAAAHVLGLAASNQDSNLRRYLDSGAPGGALFAAWMATWLAMSHSVATLGSLEALMFGPLLGLPLLLRWRLGQESELTPPSSLRGPAMIAVFAALGLGLFPGVVVQHLSPHEPSRAAEFTLMRCGDYELSDLTRPRLRSELRLGCFDPASELDKAFNRVDAERLSTDLGEANPSPTDPATAPRTKDGSD